MVENELKELLEKIQARKCEEQSVEVKAAHEGCPEKLYDTLSAFSNQDSGGTLVFGLDEKQNFKKVGVYDAQDLQKKVMEYGEQMTPVVRPVFTVYAEADMVFVSAEVPPVDLSERPCFKTARGRLQGSYIRVGDADKPMTEYEVYSYEAFRKKYRDDLREVPGASLAALDQVKVEDYLLQRKKNRPHLETVPLEQLYELTGILHNGSVTMAAVMLFSPYPQAYFPQLGVIATCVPSTEMGILDETGRRFTDSKRVEGTLAEMLEGCLAFIRNNMRTATVIDQKTGKRTDIPQYPMDAVREAVLNALVHRDYSLHTEGMPIQLVMYTDRLEVSNPGGLYGRRPLAASPTSTSLRWRSSRTSSSRRWRFWDRPRTVTLGSRGSGTLCRRWIYRNLFFLTEEAHSPSHYIIRLRQRRSRKKSPQQAQRNQFLTPRISWRSVKSRDPERRSWSIWQSPRRSMRSAAIWIPWSRAERSV